MNTNVLVAAFKTHNRNSPNAELIRRWEQGEFEIIYSPELRAEYAEKFADRHVDSERAARFLATLDRLGIAISVPPDRVTAVVIQDPDDDLPLACAVIGRASHLVSYDQHYAFLDGEYRGVRIVDGLHFLYLVRGDKSPGQLA